MMSRVGQVGTVHAAAEGHYDGAHLLEDRQQLPSLPIDTALFAQISPHSPSSSGANSSSIGPILSTRRSTPHSGQLMTSPSSTSRSSISSSDSHSGQTGCMASPIGRTERVVGQANRLRTVTWLPMGSSRNSSCRESYHFVRSEIIALRKWQGKLANEGRSYLKSVP